MTRPGDVAPQRDSRVLVLSQRNVRRTTWHAPQYEMEDVLCAVDDVDLLQPPPHPRPQWDVQRRRVVNGVGARVGARRRTPPWNVPGMASVPVVAEHDLFFAVFHHLDEVGYLESVPGWRERCRTAACMLVEMWPSDLERDADYARRLAQFDHVFLVYPGTAHRLRELGTPSTSFLPTAVDALRFSPLPLGPRRVVDVYSYGRRSESVHRSLRDLAERSGRTYVHDTRAGGTVEDAADHRRLVAHLMQRSRFFLAHRINDSPEKARLTGGGEAISTRYFEGAAGGAVMLGSRTRSAEFDAAFDWEDAVVPLPFDSVDAAEALLALEPQHERWAEARARNVGNSLRRHDWAHRWSRVLAQSGLPSLPGLRRRELALEELADAAVAGAFPD